MENESLESFKDETPLSSTLIRDRDFSLRKALDEREGTENRSRRGPSGEVTQSDQDLHRKTLSMEDPAAVVDLTESPKHVGNEGDEDIADDENDRDGGSDAGEERLSLSPYSFASLPPVIPQSALKRNFDKYTETDVKDDGANDGDDGGNSTMELLRTKMSPPSNLRSVERKLRRIPSPSPPLDHPINVSSRAGITAQTQQPYAGLTMPDAIPPITTPTSYFAALQHTLTARSNPYSAAASPYELQSHYPLYHHFFQDINLYHSYYSQFYGHQQQQQQQRNPLSYLHTSHINPYMTAMGAISPTAASISAGHGRYPTMQGWTAHGMQQTSPKSTFPAVWTNPPEGRGGGGGGGGGMKVSRKLPPEIHTGSSASMYMPLSKKKGGAMKTPPPPSPPPVASAVPPPSSSSSLPFATASASVKAMASVHPKKGGSVEQMKGIPALKLASQSLPEMKVSTTAATETKTTKPVVYKKPKRKKKIATKSVAIDHVRREAVKELPKEGREPKEMSGREEEEGGDEPTPNKKVIHPEPLIGLPAAEFSLEQLRQMPCAFAYVVGDQASEKEATEAMRKYEEEKKKAIQRMDRKRKTPSSFSSVSSVGRKEETKKVASTSASTAGGGRCSGRASQPRAVAKEIFCGVPDEPLPGGWPPGWTKKVVQRASGATKGMTDRYWFSPKTKRKFRSMIEVRKFLKALESVGGEDEDRAYDRFKGRN